MGTWTKMYLVQRFQKLGFWSVKKNVISKLRGKIGKYLDPNILFSMPTWSLLKHTYKDNETQF